MWESLPVFFLFLISSGIAEDETSTSTVVEMQELEVKPPLMGDNFREGENEVTSSILTPRFTHRPHNVSVVDGGEATLMCGVTSLQGYKLAWVHEDSQSILTVGRLMYTQSPRLNLAADRHRTAITLSPVRASDRGWYMCQLNTDPMMAARAYLQVLVRPVVTKWSGPMVEATEGSTITLECFVTSHPPAQVTWAKADRSPVFLPTRGGPVWSVSGPVLVFSSVKRRESGPYTCTASDATTPPVVKTTHLVVTYAPMLWLPRDKVGAEVGDDIDLECTTDGYPEPEVHWTKHQRIVEEGAKYSQSVTSVPPPDDDGTHRLKLTLRITNVTQEDFTEYRCNVVNRLGAADGGVEIYEIKEQLIKGPYVRDTKKKGYEPPAPRNHPSTTSEPREVPFLDYGSLNHDEYTFMVHRSKAPNLNNYLCVTIITLLAVLLLR